MPEDVESIGQIKPEVLVEIIARSLWLISNGDIKFPITLPANIASRHRICTNMASKIKECGFTGDCGYNQLLYPVENQTRTLLLWLVQKLPRSEEDQAEEVLGTNALLNKKITTTLSEWRKRPYLLPGCCIGTPARNIYSTRSLATVPSTTSDRISNRKIKAIFAGCHARSIFAESTLLEKHALELISDGHFETTLAANNNSSDATGTGSGVEGQQQSRDLLSLSKAALSSVMSKDNSTSNNNNNSGVVTGAGSSNTGVSCSTGDMQTDLLSSSLADIIAKLGADSDGSVSGGSNGNSNSSSDGDNGDGGSGGAGGRGSRFSHAAEFAKDSVSDAMLSLTSENFSATGVGTIAEGDEEGDEVDAEAEAALAAQLAALSTAAEKEKALQEERLRKKRVKEEEMERKREAELQGLRDANAEAQAAMDAKLRSIDNIQAQIRQLEAEHTAAVLASEALEKEIVIKRKTLEMLPTAADNIAKLQQICASSAKKLMTLAQEWEKHRIPLLEQYRMKRNIQLNRKTRCKQMIDEMRRYKEEMQGMLMDLKNKQEKSRLLEDEIKKLPKNINRNLYTVRILDIIHSISKQDKDIKRITTDIREIQKTINVFTNTVQRADAVAEDKVYSAANGINRDAAMIESYRHLTTLRAKFEALIGVVNKIGQMEKQTRDLETKIDQEVSRVSNNNFERIKNDLEEIKKENGALVSQIKSVQQQQKQQQQR